MGRSRSSVGGTARDTTSSLAQATTQHGGSSSLDYYPEVSPEDASRRAAVRKKSLTSSRDQLLYLQALYPYAAYDELMAVIASTDGADEAARRAYGALNPDYTGYAYLKEQHDVQIDPKLPSSLRRKAFSGLKESLEERAASALRPGIYTNLSQLHEYHDTVGLFIVDTSEWDRETLLHSRDLAEVAFVELPLCDGPSRGDGTTTTHDSDDADDGGRSKGRSLTAAVTPPCIESSIAFVDPRHGRMQSVCSSGASRSQPAARTGNASKAHSSHVAEEQTAPLPPQDSADGGVVYLQKSDPPCPAPIIAWAPEAIRVGPAEARRERDEALRVFDEATFFASLLFQETVPPPPPPGTHIVAETERPSVPRDTAGNSLLVPPSPRSAPSLPLADRPAFHADEPASAKAHDPFELDTRPLPQREDGADGRNVEEVFCAPEPSIGCAPKRQRSLMPTPRLETRVNVNCSTGDARRDSRDTVESSAATVQTQHSMRDAARESLKQRKPHPLTTSEKVRQRMRSLTTIGNLIFRETSLHTPLALSKHDRDVHQRLSTSAGGEGACALSITTNDTQRRSSAAAGDSGDRATVAVHRSGVDTDDAHEELLIVHGVTTIPVAHHGCSSLDPAAFLNAEEERWNMIVRMLAPYEAVFGTKFRCELVRCIYEGCPRLRESATLILQRLLGVLGKALRGKELAEGMMEEPLELPFFGSVLLTTSPVKLVELTFRTHKCSMEFCEEGTRLRVKINVKRMELEPIQFAYIDEAEAARQTRLAQQAQRNASAPRTRAAAYSLRTRLTERYTEGVTSGTATVSAADVRVEGVGYVWLMATGKTHVAFPRVKVSVGSFSVSTTVTKLNVLCTLGAPILRLIVQRTLAEALRGTHTF